MKYIISGRNVEVTNAMKEYAEKKVSRVEKFFNEDTDANITFSVQKNRHVAEVTIYFEGVTYRAEATNDDLYVSIDKSIDLLEGQLRKSKTKKRNYIELSLLRWMDFLNLKIMLKERLLKLRLSILSQ